MPELPEVETVRRGLAPVMEQAIIEGVELRRPDLRFPLPAGLGDTLKGKKITSLSRRAKFLIMENTSGPALICHLGMSGSFRVDLENGAETPGQFHHERFKDERHDHVVFRLRRDDGSRARVIYNDPRRFGFMLFADDPGAAAMLSRLGVEPTGNEFDGRTLADLLRGKAAPLKAALLDQSLVAGLGNIYVSEALWRAGLSPKRAAGTIVPSSKPSGTRTDLLASAVRDVIAEAIDAGGSSLRDYVHTDGSLGYFQHSFSVYDRAGHSCQKPGCDGTITSIVQSGRSTYYCPVCQR